MKKQYIAPYVNFQGRAREAMELYQKVFGGKLELFASGEKGAPKPAGVDDRIMHARLEADDFVIIASDGHPSYPPTTGDNLAIVYAGSDKARMTEMFNTLAEGGKVKMAITDAAWGAAGWLTDRFGVNWNFDVQKS